MRLWSLTFLLCATECLAYSRIHSVNSFMLILDKLMPCGSDSKTILLLYFELSLTLLGWLR